MIKITSAVLSCDRPGTPAAVINGRGRLEGFSPPINLRFAFKGFNPVMRELIKNNRFLSISGNIFHGNTLMGRTAITSVNVCTYRKKGSYLRSDDWCDAGILFLWMVRIDHRWWQKSWLYYLKQVMIGTWIKVRNADVNRFPVDLTIQFWWILNVSLISHISTVISLFKVFSEEKFQVFRLCNSCRHIWLTRSLSYINNKWRFNLFFIKSGSHAEL